MRICVLVVFFLSFESWASRVRFGAPELAGIGCPSGTVTTAMSPDQSSFAIVFEQYVIQAPTGTARPLSVNCRFRIPILELPKGQTLRAMWIDYRGFISVPKNVFAELKTSNRVWTYDSSENPPQFSTNITTNVNFPMESPFYHRVRSNQNHPRKCTSNAAIEVATEMHLTPNAVRQRGKYRYIPFERDVIFALDSADGGPIRVGIDLEPCNENECTLPGYIIEEARGVEKPDQYREWPDDRCCNGIVMHGGPFEHMTCYYNWRD